MAPPRRRGALLALLLLLPAALPPPLAFPSLDPHAAATAASLFGGGGGGAVAGSLGGILGGGGGGGGGVRVARAWHLWTDTEPYPWLALQQEMPNGGTNVSLQLPLKSPGPRAAHSLHLWNDSAYLFGGRGNEIVVVHDPRTYQIARVNGSLLFQSYDQKHFAPCLDSNLTSNNAPGANLTDAQYAACYDISVGTYFNDVWRYDLTCARQGGGKAFRGSGEGQRFPFITSAGGAAFNAQPTTTFDSPCEDESAGWSMLKHHAVLGGCTIYNESEVCSHPHERFQHVSAILSNATQVPTLNASGLPALDAHGQPITALQEDAYLLIYGGFARMCEDYCDDMWALNLAACQRNETICVWDKVKPSFGRTGPGKRGRAASTSDASKWVIFGGLRQWQGFAPANDITNHWSDTTAYPIGGYLDDLWIYTLSPDGPASLFGARNTGLGTTLFEGAHPTDYTTGRWNSTKPRDKLGGNEAVGTRDLLFGEPVSAGLGAWAQVLPREACYSYPGAAYTARNDVLCSITWPQARADGALALFGELLFLHGGYSCPFPYPHVSGRGSGPGVASLASDSEAPYPSYPYYLDDLWHLDFVSGTWQRVTPASPTSPSGRVGHSIVLAGAALLLVGGYAENYFNSDLWIYNITTNMWLQKTYYTHALLPASCTDDTAPDPDPGHAPGSVIAVSESVAGEPTRGTVLDGHFGRASAPVLVPQARRAAPGWDGCVSRQDGRPDLPHTLQWEQPSQRAFHRAVFSEKFDLMLLYGGETLFREQVETRALTWPTQADGQLWMWGRWACPSNCSLHGDCWYGHCYCYDGYYGIDCSNSSCPGTYCHYDTTQHLQICQHCCSATYIHTDADVYVENRRKVPCDADHYGLSHGICDGFGQCQCAPPFLTDDCSVRDCPNNCSGAGVCSVEYPVSRCMCTPPATGSDCSRFVCANNCSYPNGECNTTSGLCNCASIRSPYNRSVFFDVYAGLDCSFVRPFAGARGAGGAALGLAAALAASLLLLLAHFPI